MQIVPKAKLSRKRVSLARNSYSLSILKHLVRSSISVIEKRDVVFNDVYEQIISELHSPRRNQLKLYLLLQSYPKFKYFLNSYMIPQKAMIECLHNIKLFTFKPDEHVFNLGDKSDLPFSLTSQLWCASHLSGGDISASRVGSAWMCSCPYLPPCVLATQESLQTSPDLLNFTLKPA